MPTLSDLVKAGHDPAGRYRERKGIPASPWVQTPAPSTIAYCLLVVGALVDPGSSGGLDSRGLRFAARPTSATETLNRGRLRGWGGPDEVQRGVAGRRDRWRCEGSLIRLSGPV